MRLGHVREQPECGRGGSSEHEEAAQQHEHQRPDDGPPEALAVVDARDAEQHGEAACDPEGDDGGASKALEAVAPEHEPAQEDEQPNARADRDGDRLYPARKHLGWEARNPGALDELEDRLAGP